MSASQHESLSAGLNWDRFSPYRVVPIGVAFWIAGVVSIRLLLPLGAFRPGLALPLLAATIPVTWLTVRLGKRLLRLDDGALVPGMALLSVPALLLDGIVLRLAPWVYSPDDLQCREAAAWLLWFVGSTLAVAWVWSARNRR